MIPQADARLGQLVESRPPDAAVTAVKLRPRSIAALSSTAVGRRLGGDEDHAGAVGALLAAIADEERFFVRLQQAVDGDERVVVACD